MYSVFFLTRIDAVAANDVIFISIALVMMVLLLLLIVVEIPRAETADEKRLQDSVDQMQVSFTSDGYRISVGRATDGTCCPTETACLDFERIGRTTTAVV